MSLYINKHFKTHIKDNTYLKPSYKIENNVSFDSDIENPYYIFFRLYDVEYINPLSPSSILKFGVDTTEIYDIHASHVSINFSLKDNFYGLTSGGKYQLAIESCTNSKANKFTKLCNPITSNQITYAIAVTKEEWENTKTFVEDYASSTDTRFSIIQDFKIAKFATVRKFFTDKEKQPFGNMTYPKDRYYNLKKKVMGVKKENHFICSSFIAYSLISNVQKIKDWFDEKKINYRYVNVTDVVNIPGCQRLFSSKFNEYNKATTEFAELNPSFKLYL